MHGSLEVERTTRAVGIIPARFASTRLPEKVLRPLAGKPLVQWVWEAARDSRRLREVWIATDHADVARVAEGFGARVAMTSASLASGTDRAAAVLRERADWRETVDVIVNLQADEPLLRSSDIDRLVAVFDREPGADAATLAVEHTPSSVSPSRLRDPHCVKLVRNAAGRALYFSRAPLAKDPEGGFYQHIGIYAYRCDVLRRVTEAPRSALERAENLEQLRAVEMGFEFWVELVDHPMVGVDTPEDLVRVEAYLASGGGRG